MAYSSYDEKEDLKRVSFLRFWLWGATIILSVVILSLGGCPVYSVWQRGLAGEAELRQANWSRQIKVTEAKAAEEAAKHLAVADIERAKGVAKSNQIIGESLKENEVYLKWLWVEGMKEHNGKTVVYVPTETNLPVLEATRLATQSAHIKK